MKENEDDNSKEEQNGHEHGEEQSNESSVFNREMYREEFVDDFDFFRKRFKEMGCDIDSVEGENKVMEFFKLWRGVIRRTESQQSRKNDVRHFRIRGPEDLEKFMNMMQSSAILDDEPVEIDSKHFKPDQRHMTEDSRERRDRFRKEWG